jgi:hypothetical protein
MLKQVGVGAGAGKKDLFTGKAVNQEQITLYMTFGIAAVIAGKGMFPAAFRQGFFPNNHSHNIKNFINVLMPSFHKIKVFYEFVSKYRGKHGTALQGFFQSGFEFFAGLVLTRVYEYGAGDFPPQYGLALLEGGDSLGIRDMYLAAFGANIARIRAYPYFGFFSQFYAHSRLLYPKYTHSRRKTQAGLFLAFFLFPFSFFDRPPLETSRMALRADSG